MRTIALLIILFVMVLVSCDASSLENNTEILITPYVTYTAVTETNSVPTEALTELPETVVPNSWFYTDSEMYANPPLIKEGADINQLICGMTYIEVMEAIGPGVYRNPYISHFVEGHIFNWRIDDSTRLTINFDYVYYDDAYIFPVPNCEYVVIVSASISKNEKAIAVLDENGWMYYDDSISK